MKQKMPSLWWYAISAGLALICFACIAGWFIMVFYTAETSGIHVVVPGEANLELSKTGTYTIYYEYKSRFNNKIFQTDKELADSLDCSVKSCSTGDEIPLDKTTVPATYYYFHTHKVIEGVSIFKFRITAPGEYTLKANYIDGLEDTKIVLQIQKSLFETFWVSGVILYLTLSLLVLISGGIFWITFYKRWKAKKTVKNASMESIN